MKKLFLCFLFLCFSIPCFANPLPVNDTYGAELMRNKMGSYWPDAYNFVHKNDTFALKLDSQFNTAIAFEPNDEGYVNCVLVMTNNTANLPLYLYYLQIVFEGYDGLVIDDEDAKNAGMIACNLTEGEYAYFYSIAMKRWYIYYRIKNDINDLYFIKVMAMDCLPS